VILKKGFDSKYLTKEIEVRSKFKFIPTPEIKFINKSPYWYIEEYISGSSPDRMNNKKGEEIIIKATKYIHKMLKSSTQKELVSLYISTLERKIEGCFSDSSNINLEIRDRIKKIVELIVNKLEKYGDMHINTAYCHGDFQLGNIICNKNLKFWIIDWEFSGKKQISYDLLVLLLKSRYKNGLTKRFINLIDNNINKFNLNLMSNWPGISFENKKEMGVSLLIFIFEELIFHVSESSNKQFYPNFQSLEERLNQFESISKLPIFHMINK